MHLYHLLEKINYTLICGSDDVTISILTHDSREVIKDACFVCIQGAKWDGHEFLDEVVHHGAKVIIVEKEVAPIEGITILRVDDTREALSHLAAAYYDHPATKLTTIGITGTKGKTTTAYMIKAILERAGYKTGLIGTIEVLIGDKHIKTYNTTPDTLLIQRYLRDMVDDGCRIVVMEVSSQGLKLQRVASIFFDIGVFTNLYPDHIGPDEHESYEEYVKCKAKLFRQCKIGIINSDAKELKELLWHHTCSVETYSMKNNAMLRGGRIRLIKQGGLLGIQFMVNGCVKDYYQLFMPGIFNVYNCLAAIMVARHFRMDRRIIKDALKEIQVKGRLEMIPYSNEFTVMIDYAHNAVSLQNVLEMLRDYQPARIICLFGCGGNRSKLRRYEMGEVASKLADLTVVTSDNPRDEDGDMIIEDIIVGVHRASGKYIRIKNRKEAIRYCLTNAKKNDVILLAGKGHETYQEIRGVRYHMDEREIINDIKKESMKEEKGNE
ncbi:UDP-N-acetylmuramoylalanyl-D-glutamate--2,6-diaminopimelate ligase [Lachnospiraceae bacterium KM106-2]|nr:UDP-N-acetylmuramoylalanyl-D-glutamate--2,6-diaminopimelate ligase [Lachnospiraceae bacterium KM106-2]